MGIPGLVERQGLHSELTCFTAMLTRTELMEPSIRTFSFSFLLMVTGCNRSSLLLLKTQCHKALYYRGTECSGRPHTGPRITSWDQSPRNRRFSSRTAPRWGPVSVFSMERAQALESGQRGFEIQLLCYFSWATYPTGISIFSSVKWLIPISLARTERDKKGSSVQ